MFQPQPTPYAACYGMGSGIPGYAYDLQPRLTPTNTYFGGEQGADNQGAQELGGAGGACGEGSFGPGGGVPVEVASGFGGVAGIGASGLGATGLHTAAAASGPTRVTSLLFTSAAFDNNQNSQDARTTHKGPESGACNPVTNDFSRHQRQPTGSFPSYSHHQAQPHVKMESELSADLAAQEAAAREYQPHLEGPLVGEKTPSHAITEAYAKADPVYVQKTLALPQTYSHYRPVQGDGNCGWRAIGFGYFEALIRTGNAQLVGAERDRLVQYPILDHSEMVYEDMRDEVAYLMNDIQAALPDQEAAMNVLLQKFNDLDVANHILYYLRLLTSSFLKGDPNANEYLGFIPEDMGIMAYCQNYLELPGREIEHLGVQLLYNVLLKPCAMVIEIAYLDRSPGPQVNTYRIPSEADGQDASTLGPVMYLLFRPDHYDILYPHPAPLAPLDIQVNRVSSFSHEHHITPNIDNLEAFGGVDMTTLSLIPGLGVGRDVPSLALPTASSIESYSPSPQSPWMATPFAETLPIRQQALPKQEQSSAPSLRAVSLGPHPIQGQTPPLRFSEYCHPQVVENYPSQEPRFTTNTFKNSHFNTAHYNNPNFQPEEYRPEQDESNYEAVRPAGKRRSH